MNLMVLSVIDGTKPSREDHFEIGPKFDKFKSDMGTRRGIAERNGATYELHSSTPIPERVKAWLTSKETPFFEHL